MIKKITSFLLAALTAFGISAAAFAADFDANGDKKTTAADALTIIRAITSGTADMSLDANGDGKVTAADALFVLRLVTGYNPYEKKSIVYDYPKKWAYSLLNDKQKAFYEYILENAEAGNYDKDLVAYDLRMPYDTDLINAVRYAIYLDNGHIIDSKCWFSVETILGEFVYEINIPRDRSEKEMKTAKPAFEKETKKIIDEVNKLRTDYEKVKYIYDSILFGMEYDVRPASGETSFRDFADGAVVYGKGVCEAYTKGFVYLCQAAGIECVCVYGESDGAEHIWNKVKIDGKWYNVDATWDDEGDRSDYNYFLRDDRSFDKEHTPYDYCVSEYPKAPRDYKLPEIAA